MHSFFYSFYKYHTGFQDHKLDYTLNNNERRCSSSYLLTFTAIWIIRFCYLIVHTSSCAITANIIISCFNLHLTFIVHCTKAIKYCRISARCLIFGFSFTFSSHLIFTFVSIFFTSKTKASAYFPFFCLIFMLCLFSFSMLSQSLGFKVFMFHLCLL